MCLTACGKTACLGAEPHVDGGGYRLPTKHRLLRTLAARTVSSLWHALGDLLDRINPKGMPQLPR
jgi:hypothetical protein